MRTLVFFCLFVLSACATIAEDDPRLEKYEIFGTVLGQISKNYIGETDWINDDYFDEVSTSEKDLPTLIHDAVARLDPRSEYIEKDRFRALRLNSSSDDADIGLSIMVADEKYFVSRVRTNSPAARNNILPGDQILAINEKIVSRLKGLGIAQSLRGEPGSEVSVRFERGGVGRTIKFTREINTEKNVTFHRKDNVVVVQIRSFNSSTVEDVSPLLKILNASPDGPLESLIIDLRGNGGGLLVSCSDMADLFLDGGEIFYTQGRGIKNIKKYTAEKGDVMQERPIIIVVNEFTGSGAELFTLSMQARNRAIIVGEQTAGKGVVQTVIPIDGGRYGALKITSEKMFVANGVGIDGIGVVPDVASSGFDDQVLMKASQIALSGNVSR
ncbi:S41 family peptidase [Litorimonas sp. WD9-15]|uniref:S41 family peptidase n=1 Tax=Litorimonas sp. WD9-15 TaxID=3418716 RepID=UPI003CFEEABD